MFNIADTMVIAMKIPNGICENSPNIGKTNILITIILISFTTLPKKKQPKKPSPHTHEHSVKKFLG